MNEILDEKALSCLTYLVIMIITQYYILINFWGQLISWFDKDVLQIKYEDFVNHPEDIFQKIEHHIFVDE